jgi:hypothetical protein
MASSLAAEAQSGQAIVDVQKHLRHPDLQWMGATLDGRVRSNGAVFEAKFMLPWSFSEEAALEKHAPQLQHNMWVVAARSAVLSIITGKRQMGRDQSHGRSPLSAPDCHGRAEILALRGERRTPALFGVEPPKPRVEAVRIVDMGSSNSWAEFAAAAGASGG